MKNENVGYEVQTVKEGIKTLNYIYTLKPRKIRGIKIRGINLILESCTL